MGRPRQFEEAAAVDAAATEFRQRGYASTSIDHLVAATSVHRASLYSAFGSKHGLFLRALDATADANTEARLDLVLVALLELAPADTRVQERIEQTMRTFGITPQQLGDRILRRAGISTDKEPT